MTLTGSYGMEIDWREVCAEQTLSLSKARGFFSAELVICMVVGMILLVGAFLGFREFKDNANRTTAHREMTMLKNGVVAYAGLSRNSQPPANLGVLLANPSLSADDAIDQVDHVQFVEKKVWSTSGDSILDPWGDPYEYSYDATTGTGEIRSKGNGKPIVVTF